MTLQRYRWLVQSFYTDLYFFKKFFLYPSVVLVVPFIKSALLEKVGHYDLIRRIGLLNKKWELQVHTISYLMIYMFCSISFISFQFGIGNISFFKNRVFKFIE